MIGPFSYGWKAIALVAVMAGSWAFGFSHGSSATGTAWKSKWDEHVAADADAAREAEATARTEEQRRQQSVNKVIQDGQQQIDIARADADAAAARAGSLRDEADRIAQRLSDSEAGRSACTVAAGKAAAHYSRMLADVLKLADQAAGVMATAADQSRARGLICERSYDAVKGFE